MMTRTLAFFLIPLSLFLFAEIDAQTVQYEDLIIDSIDFYVVQPGGQPVHSPELKGRIKSREADLFSQAAFDNDLKILSQEFAVVTPSIDVHGSNLSIRIDVLPKPTIRGIFFEGNRHYGKGRLIKEMELRPGDVFDRLSFSKAFRQLKSFYVSKGFFETEMDYVIESLPDCGEVDIVITVSEGRSGKIKAINFRGLDRCDQAVILERLVTKKYNFLMSWFSNEGVYNEDAMQHDKYTIIDYLHNQGYADAVVDIVITEATSSNRIIVNINAVKGELYRFGEVTFEGNTLFTDGQIANCFTIKEGCPFSPEALRTTVQNLLNLYGRCGYIEAVVDFEPELDKDCPSYKVNFSIEEGEQYRVGLIKVFGNVCTQSRVILHETLLIPGEVFNLEKLKATEARLTNVGYFSCVNVYAVRSEDECELGANYRDVHIEVEETSTGSFSAFGGLSNIENIFGGVQIAEKNFNWRGLGCFWQDGLCSLRGGGEYAFAKVTIGSESQAYGISWTKPYFKDTKWVVGFDVDYSHVQYIAKAYEINAISFTLHGKYPINDYVRAGTYYRFRDSHVKLTTEEDIPDSLKKQAKISGIVSAIGFNLGYDSTNHPIKPTAGMRSKIELEIAGLGGVNFLGLGYLNNWYYGITCDDVFKTRADFRFLQPYSSARYDKMPIDERLFLGGESGVRGYRPYALGPKFAGTQTPAGGMTSSILSAELVHRFSPKWEIFGFTDLGHLTESLWSFRDYKASAGVGIRMCVIPGGPPVTLGYGWPIKESNKSDIKNFFFSVGWGF